MRASDDGTRSVFIPTYSICGVGYTSFVADVTAPLGPLRSLEETTDKRLIYTSDPGAVLVFTFGMSIACLYIRCRSDRCQVRESLCQPGTNPLVGRCFAFLVKGR